MKDPRKSLAKALSKLAPEYCTIMTAGVDDFTQKLATYDFQITGEPSDDVGPFWEQLWFERQHSESAFAYIDAGFSRDGEPTFGSAFGIREYAPPNEWHLNANLSKKRLGFWRTCDLGAIWPLPFKRQMFERDWRFLMANVDDIVHFLETGEPNKNMSEVLVTERFEPKRK